MWVDDDDAIPMIPTIDREDDVLFLKGVDFSCPPFHLAEVRLHHSDQFFWVYVFGLIVGFFSEDHAN